MGREVITTDNAPAAIGPYSQAVRVGDFVYTAGQIPLDPRTGEIVGTTAPEQTHRALENVVAVLAATGLGLEHVVKVTMFIRDMDHFAAINETYATFFPYDPPARSVVEVSRLPKDVLVEIETIAYGG